MRERLFHLLRRAAPRVPRREAAALAVVVGGLAYRSAGSMRAAALHNMGRLLDLPEDRPEVRRAALGAFCTLARNYVDLFSMAGASAAHIRERTEVVGMEHLRAALDRGRGAVIATAHLGSLDEGGQALIVRGIPCAVVTERVRPDWLFDFYLGERRRFGGEIVPLGAGTLSRLLALVRAGRPVGVACDWDIQGNGVPVRVPGFRWPLRIPNGAGLLALRAGAPLITIWGERRAGRMRAIVEPEVPVERSGDARADLRRVAELVGARMLPQLRSRPHQWVLFHPVWADDAAA